MGEHIHSEHHGHEEHNHEPDVRRFSLSAIANSLTFGLVEQMSHPAVQQTVEATVGQCGCGGIGACAGCRIPYAAAALAAIGNKFKEWVGSKIPTPPDQKPTNVHPWKLHDVGYTGNPYPTPLPPRSFIDSKILIHVPTNVPLGAVHNGFIPPSRIAFSPYIRQPNPQNGDRRGRRAA